MCRILQLAVIAVVISLSRSSSYNFTLPYEFEDISTEPVDYFPSINKSTIYVCIDALEVDIRNQGQLLAGICSFTSVNLAGPIINIPIDDRTKYEVVAGTVNRSKLTPGDWDAPQLLQRAQYFHQTSDKAKILFADDNSCIREYDRNTKVLRTLIGNSAIPCGQHTLDILNNDKAIYGMAYDESKEIFYLGVANEGLYAYRNTSSVYVRQLLIQRTDVTKTIPGVRNLLLFGGYLWHKVGYGVNRYDTTRFPTSGSLAFDDDIFVRFLSSSGGATTPDSTARYRIDDPQMLVSTSDAALRMAPDNTTLMIADTGANRLFFLNTSDGALSVICKSNLTDSIDSTDPDNCTFTDLYTALWLSQYKIFAYEKRPSHFRTVLFKEPPSTTAPPLRCDKPHERVGGDGTLCVCVLLYGRNLELVCVFIWWPWFLALIIIIILILVILWWFGFLKKLAEAIQRWCGKVPNETETSEASPEEGEPEASEASPEEGEPVRNNNGPYRRLEPINMSVIGQKKPKNRKKRQQKTKQQENGCTGASSAERPLSSEAPMKHFPPTEGSGYENYPSNQ